MAVVPRSYAVVLSVLSFFLMGTEGTLLQQNYRVNEIMLSLGDSSKIVYLHWLFSYFTCSSLFHL